MNEGAPEKAIRTGNEDIAIFQRAQQEQLESFARILRAYRAGDFSVEASQKERRFALLAVEIERFWAYFEDALDESSGGLMKYGVGLHEPDELYSEERIRSEMTKMSELRARRNFLATRIHDTMTVFMQRFFLENFEDPTMLQLDRVVVTRENIPRVNTVPKLLDAGFGTAVNFMWYFFEHAPAVYKRDTHDVITREAYGALLRNSSRAVEALSSLHVARLDMAQEELLFEEGSSILGSSGNYILVQDEKGLRLGFSPDFLERFQQHIEGAALREGGLDQRLGCPALYARTRDGKSVVVALHIFAANEFERYFDLLWTEDELLGLE